MKLTKNDIKQKRAELAEKILEIDAARKEKELIESLLADDFRENRDAYEIGVATPKGLLFRKPSYKCTAKPVVEVA